MMILHLHQTRVLQCSVSRHHSIRWKFYRMFNPGYIHQLALRVMTNFSFRRGIQCSKTRVRRSYRIRIQLSPVGPQFGNITRPSRLTNSLRARAHPSFRHQRKHSRFSPKLDSPEAENLVPRRDDDLVRWRGRRVECQLRWRRGQLFILKQLLYSVTRSHVTILNTQTVHSLTSFTSPIILTLFFVLNETDS